VASPRHAQVSGSGRVAVLALPTLLVSMDLTVLHLAVPQLSADLTPTSSQLLWLVDIYGFMVAGLLVTMGTLGDRVGRRRVLLTGAAAFGLASLLAAFSTSASMLIASRAVLGVAGATLLPSTLALIRHMFVDERQRGIAIGAWVAIFSSGTAVGPVLGGALLDRYWWGSVFLLGVPVMAALLVVGRMLLPEFRDPDAARLDPGSVALSLSAILPVIYGLKQIAENGIGTTTVGAIAGGLVAGALFLARQQRLADPLIDLTLFRNRAFSASLIAMILVLFVWSGAYLLIVQYLQLVLGLSPMSAGLWLMLGGVGSILGGMLAPMIVGRAQPAHVVAGGLAIAAVGLTILTQVDATDGQSLVVVSSVLVATGAAVVVSIGTGLVVGSAPPERAGTAAGIGETANELGLALGIAIIGSVGTAIFRGDLTDTVPSGTPNSLAVSARETLGGALAVADRLPASIGGEFADAARIAFTHGLRVAGIVGFPRRARRRGHLLGDSAKGTNERRHE
jgi:MFS transporter, DHA2 family, multidrug resistance protein